MTNVAELNRVLEHWAADPAHHDQWCWFDYPRYEDVWIDTDEDGPALAEGWRQHIIACVAGWTAILNGWRPVHPDSLQVINDAGQIADAATVARKILDLSADEAMALFARSWTLGEPRQLVATITKETR